MKTRACLVLSLGLVLFLLGGLVMSRRLNAQLKPMRAFPPGTLVMEEFTLQTDGSGLAQFTLTYPLDGNLAGVFCHTEDRMVALTDIAENDVTIKVLKTAYAKVNEISGSTLGNLPSGVSSVNAVQTLHGVTGSPTSYGSYAQYGSGQYASAGHVHLLNIPVPFLYVHNHNMTTSETVMPAAANESGLRVVVLYKRY